MSRATDAMCEGFTPDKGERPWRYALRAAFASNNAAIVSFVFAMPVGLNPNKPVEDVDGWAAYRDHAPGLLQRAIDDGYPPAYALAATASLGSPFGGNLLPKDPVRAAAYYLALTSRSSPEYRAELQRNIQALNLSDAQMASASAMAVPLAGKLRVPSEGPIDFTGGISPNNDARECSE